MMMKLLDKLILTTLLKAILFASLVMMGLDGFFTLLGELDDIGKADYTFIKAVYYVLLSIPGHLYAVLPLVFLLGVVMCITRLAQHKELIMMQLYGLSTSKILKRMAFFAVVLSLICLAAAELIVPVTNQKAIFLRTIAKSHGQVYKARGGVWMRYKNQFVHIKKVLPNGHLSGVTLYQFDKAHQLIKTRYAKKAYYAPPNWQFYHVKETRFTQPVITSKNYKKQTWPVHIEPGLFSVVLLTADDVSIYSLFSYIGYLKQNHLAFSDYAVSLYKRLLAPLENLFMMVLAALFLLGPFIKTRASLKLILGAAFTFAMYVLNQISINVTLSYHFPPIFAVLLPILLLGVLTTYGVRRL